MTHQIARQTDGPEITAYPAINIISIDVSRHGPFWTPLLDAMRDGNAIKLRTGPRKIYGFVHCMDQEDWGAVCQIKVEKIVYEDEQ